MPSRTMIKVENLCKTFGQLVAVDDVSFEVHPGDVLGFLGPNGAGKSTTMKMVCGFLRQTSGRVSICDFDIAAQPIEAKRIIGYLPEGAPSYGEMTVSDFLYFIARARQLDKAQTANGFDYVVEELALQSVLMQPVDTLSKGFKRRVGLAQALMHDPRVLVMDEPTDGLDPNQKHHVRALINSLSKDKIVVISTHILEEVSAVCTRALIIAQGRLLTDSTPKELLEQSRYHHAISLQSGDRDAVKALEALDGVTAAEEDLVHRRWILFTKKDRQEAVYRDVKRCVADRKLAVSDLRMEQGRLDEVFREITAGSLS